MNTKTKLIKTAPSLISFQLIFPLVLLVMLNLSNYKSAFGQTYLEMMKNPEAYNLHDIQKAFYQKYPSPPSDSNEIEGPYYQFKRWESFMEPRVYPSGKMINPSKKAFDEFLRVGEEPTSDLRVLNGYWNPIGPDDYVLGSNGSKGGIGRINCIAFHPTDPDIIWVGTPAGGLWKTTNHGDTWTPLTDGIPAIGVSGIAVNPDNTNEIYILTGDGDDYDTPGIGILKTTNGGSTWSSSLSIANHGFKLAINPDDPNTLLAATIAGIYKTSDKGASWINKQPGRIYDLEFKPGNPNIIYAVSDTQYYRSSDGGDTWSITGISGLPSSPGSDRVAVAITEDDPQVVYVAYASDASGFLGIYKSDDSGLNFDLMSDSPNLFGYSDPPSNNNQIPYDFTMGVSPNASNVVYIGGINVWKSIDYGTNWYPMTLNSDESSSTGYNHPDQHAFEFNPNNSWIYTGSDGGIYYSDDYAETWHNISSGLQVNQIYSIANYEGDPDLLLLAIQDNGVNVLDGSTTMTNVNGGDGFKCIIGYNAPILTYFGYASVGTGYKIRKATSIYGNWKDISPPTVGDRHYSLIMDPTDVTTLYAGCDGIYKTTNSGNDWDELFSSTIDYTQLAMGTSNPDRIYAYGYSDSFAGTFTMSDDGGDTWVLRTGLPFSEGIITDIEVSPVNSLKAWVTFSGYSAGNKVFETTDAGATWSNISGDLPNVPVDCIVYDSGSDNDALYIGTDLGVYYRDDDLGDWIPFRNGLPNVIVDDLVINQQAGVIRAATYGRGVWSSDLYDSCPSDYTLNDANNPGSGCFQTYNCDNTITSSRKYLGGFGCNVTYNAGSYIDLTEGFQFATGGEFLGFIEGCSAIPYVLLKPLSGTYEGSMNLAGQGTLFENRSNSLTKNEKLSIYPNPSNGNINLEIKNISKKSIAIIQLSDISGKVLYSYDPIEALGNFQSKLLIPKTLENGTYLMKVNIGAETFQEKIVLLKE